MKILLLILSLVIPCVAEAKVRELSLDLKRMPFQRDFLFPDRTNWGHEVSLIADMNIGRWFIDNKIIGRTYDSRFRYIAWDYDTGFNVLPWLDILWSHKSEHALDLYRDKFPVRDSYGIRLKFVE
jgi:hypothetical protein